MGKRIGGTSISIAQLRDGYSYTEIRLYSATERTAYPLTLMYNFTTGTLLSGVDGKTLTECLNGWSQSPSTGRWCTIASARTTGDIAEIATSAWCEQFLTAKDGETVTTVTLYTRSKTTPSLPSGVLTYNFTTGTVTGDGKGDWRTSMEDFEEATAHALWSTSAIAVTTVGGTIDTIQPSEWSTPRKIAESGVSPVEMYLDIYSWVFPADRDGLVSTAEYMKFQTDVLLVRGGETIPFTLSISCQNISNISASGITVKATEDTAMVGDSATVTITATYDDGSISKTISLAKARAGMPALLYFAWSSSESEFLPQPIPRFYSNGRLYSNTKLIAGSPAGVRWIFNQEDANKYKTDVYKFLWCKTSWDGTPFLFTGVTGLTGAYTAYQYGLGDEDGNQPTTWYNTMEELFETEGSLFNSGKYLWMRSQFVEAGKSINPNGWGAPVIAGSDSSEVYARIEENKTSITSITKSGGMIDQKVTEYDTQNKTYIGSQIEQTASKIALRIDGTDVKTQAGIVVGSVDGEGQIQLSANKIILDGSVTTEKLSANSVTASKIDTADLMAQTLKIQSDGSIQSTNFESYSAGGRGAGFKLDSNGHFEANDAILGGNAIVKGVVQNDALTTIKDDSTGQTITNPTWPGGTYWLGSEARSLLTSYNATTNVTITVDGTNYTGELRTTGLNGSGAGFAVGYESIDIPVSGHISFTWHDVYRFYSDTYYSKSVTIKLSSGTVILNSSSILNYAKWPGTGISSSFTGTSSSSGNTFLGSDANSKTIRCTASTIEVEDIGSISADTMYTQSAWPVYSLTILITGKGVYVSDLYPMKSGQSNIGNVGNKFNQVYANKVIAGNFFPVGALYLTLGTEEPAELFGGSWCKLPAGYALWTAQSGVTCPTVSGDTTGGDGANKVQASLPGIGGLFSTQGTDSYKATALGAFEVYQTGAVDSGSSSSSDYANLMYFSASHMTSVYRPTDIINILGTQMIRQDDMDTVRPTSYRIYVWRRYA